MPPINKQHARSIARKLKATIDTSGKAHDLACVYHEGRLIASFGIRRGSKKSLGHGHIPNDLTLSPHDTLLLANCPMSREEWIRRVVGEEEVPEEEEEEVPEEEEGSQE
jgi:hypothetical protein